MMFDYYYNQVPIEVRCLAPWQGNKHAEKIWTLYMHLLHYEGRTTGIEIRIELDIKTYKRFRKLIKPLLNCGFVSQKISYILFTNRDYWIYEITPLGKEYYNAMTDLILPKVVK